RFDRHFDRYLRGALDEHEVVGADETRTRRPGEHAGRGVQLTARRQRPQRAVRAQVSGRRVATQSQFDTTQLWHAHVPHAGGVGVNRFLGRAEVEARAAVDVRI